MSIIDGLSPEHHAELSIMSGISDDIIRERGYQTVGANQLPPAFADYQRRDGLLIPLRTVRGEIESYQIKPHQPRIGKNAKPIKYETAANASQVIDVPPAALPHLADISMPLIITEGAKKVDAAVSAGIESTIGLQGVYGWRGKGASGGSTALADWESIALNNREVVLAFDSDVMTKPEVRGALDRLSGFLASRKAKMHYLLLPDLKDGSKCGLDDFLSLHSVDELQQYIVQELPSDGASVASSARDDDADQDRSLLRPKVFSMAEIEAKPIDWLWPNWLPKGMLTLLGGYAGDGKSTISTSLAATLSTGGVLPDGTKSPRTNTLFLVAEDDVSHVVKPRLQVHGADMDRIHVLQAVEASDGEEHSLSLRSHIPLLRQVVIEREIGLVVIDPLSSYLANGDRNSEGDVRDTLGPLVKLMEETGCAVIGIMHIGKNDGQAKAYQKLMGSTAFTALARSVWMVNNLPDEYQAEGEPTRKMLGVAKSNYAVAPLPVQYYRPLDGALEFLGPSPISLDQAFSWKPKSEKAETETDRAEEWLLSFMDGKRVLASEVEAAAKAEGIRRGTLNNAKRNLQMKSVKEQDRWYWMPSLHTDNAA